LRISIAVLLVLCAASFANWTRELTPQYKHEQEEVVVLNNAKLGLWCIYPSEARWKSDSEAPPTASVATLTTVGGILATIQLNEVDEAADYMIFNHYMIGPDGELQKLKRRVNFLPNDTATTEEYAIRNGKAFKQGRVVRSLTTGKEIANQQHDWLSKLPVITRVRDFPFASLLNIKHEKLVEKGKICTESSENH